MIAAFSQSSIQKSRGSEALCWLGVPSRRFQRLNLFRAIPSHRSNRQTGSSVLAAQRRMNWTTASRTAWETQNPVRVPQVLF